MAEACLAAGATKGLLGWIIPCLQEEWRRPKLLKDEAEHLKDDLQDIRAILAEAGLDANFGQAEHLCYQKFMKLAYKIEDTVAASMASRWSWRSLGLLGDMKALRATILAAHERYERTQRTQPRVDQVRRRRRPPSMRPAADGISRPREELMKELLVVLPRGQEEPVPASEEERLRRNKAVRLVTVLGSTREGRTALANVVYQDVRGRFDCAAFVFALPSTTPKNVLTSILHQVSMQRGSSSHTTEASSTPEDRTVEPSSSSPEDKEVDRIRKQIRSLLQHKRYLIVIDSDESAWNRVGGHILAENDGGCIPLGESNRGSRIITTTSHKTIAARLIDSLSFEGYDLGRDAAHLSSTAYHNYSMASEIWACLLYLSIFPENHIMDRGDLIRRWIAEGLVHAENPYEVGDGYFDKLVEASMILSVHADAYGRVQACRTHETVLKFITFMADREKFVTILSRKHYTQPNNQTNNPPNSRILYPPNMIVSLRNKFPVHNRRRIIKGLNDVRSLSCLFPDAAAAGSFKLPVLSWFRLLRVLHLQDCEGSSRLRGIGKLIHLRYLRVSGAGVVKLPKEVGELKLLETLDVKETGIKKLPDSMVKLQKLVSLRVGLEVELPKGIFVGMRLLEELSEVNVSINPSIAAEIETQSNGLKLEITLGTPAPAPAAETASAPAPETALAPAPNSLLKLKTIEALQDLRVFAPQGSTLNFMPDVCWIPEKIKRLAVVCPGFGILDIDTPSSSESSPPWSKLPSWIDELAELSSLCITVGMLAQDDLDTLGKLPRLAYLDLQVVKAQGQDGTQSLLTTSHHLIAGGRNTTSGADVVAFTSLVELKFSSRTVVLRFRKHAAEKLKRLSLGFPLAVARNVPRDVDGPASERAGVPGENLGLNYLASLETVEVSVDCRGAWLWEVSAAHAAMWGATNRQTNRPAFHFRTHSETKMMKDGYCRSQQNDGRCDKIGPWGGPGGREWHTNMDEPLHSHRLVSVEVRTGTIVNSLGFTCEDEQRKRHTRDHWGGSFGEKTHKFTLGEGELLQRVSGTMDWFGPWNTVVRSLTFYTNLRNYGPYGEEAVNGYHFDINPPAGRSIAGFFMRGGDYIDAIGVYLSSGSQPDKGKIGPWVMEGGKRCLRNTLGKPPMRPHRLVSVEVCSGMVVGALGFSYKDEEGERHNMPAMRSGEGQEHQKFTLVDTEEDREILEKVYGTIGPFGDCREVVTSINFRTNRRKYGPYGNEGNVTNSFEINPGRSIVGFCVRGELYIDAIGVYLSPTSSPGVPTTSD